MSPRTVPINPRVLSSTDGWKTRAAEPGREPRWLAVQTHQQVRRPHREMTTRLAELALPMLPRAPPTHRPAAELTALKEMRAFCGCREPGGPGAVPRDSNGSHPHATNN